MFKTVPALTCTAEAATPVAAADSIAVKLPRLSTPPATTTVPPPKLLEALETNNVPAPALVKAVPPVPVMMPLIVPVTSGLVTVIVGLLLPRPMLPDSDRLLPATVPPNVKLPLTVVGLAIVRAVPSDITVEPAPIVKVPVPTGPLVTAPVVPAPKMIVEAFSVTPVVKVLAPLSTTEPPPVIETWPAGHGRSGR